MKRLRLWLLLVWLSLITPAALAVSDIGLSSLAQKGLHHELIAALAPLVQAGEDVSTFRLLLLTGSYYQVGKYQEAKKTAALMEGRISAGDSSTFGADLSVYPEVFRAQIALDLGFYAEAEDHAARALAGLRPRQLFYRSQAIQIYGVLGIAQAQLGKAAEARQSLESIRAVDVASSNLGPEKFVAMARIQLALKDFPGALASIGDRDADVSPTLTLFYDPTFQNLPRFFIRAKSLFETGRLAEAKRDYDELLRNPQIEQYGAMYWIVLYDRARIALADGDAAGAVDYLARAISVIEQRRSTIADEAGRIGFVGDKQAVYAEYINIQLSLGHVDAALDAVERAKSRALVDMLASKNDFAESGFDPEQVRAALAAIDRVDRNALEKAPEAEKGGPGTVTRNVAVRHAIAEAAPALAALVTVGSASMLDIAALLGPDEALVEYYYTGTNCYVFVMASTGELWATRVVSPAIERDVNALREAIAIGRGTAWQAAAERLYAALWQPIKEHVAGIRRVLIVPHGALHYLPFGLLRSREGALLLERYGLHLVPSASVLKFLPRQPKETKGSLLVLGDPDLGDPRLDLKFAADEARAVSGMFAGSELLLRQEASKTNFRKLANRFRRVHIASHGSFRAEAPLQSGLHLAADAENDGLLTVGELYSMDVKADLVTLSACETGMGKIVNGDDVVGLSRGFLYAGARSIIASLWSVDDAATKLLMESFYQNLAHRDKLDALRQAQLYVRSRYPHPFFWSAFQLTGMAD